MTAPTTPTADDPSRPPGATNTAIHDEVVVAGLAVASAVAVGLSNCRPCGQPVVDLLWRTAFAAAFVVAGSRARPWSWVVAAATAATAAVGSVLVLPAAAGLVGQLVAVVADVRRRWVGAAGAAITVTVFAHLPTGGSPWAHALIAAVAFVPVLASAYHQSSAATRRLARRALLVATGFVLVAGVGVAFAALQSYDAAIAGTHRAQRGLDLARDGRDVAAGRELDRAARSFSRAHDDLTAPWALLARAIPVVGQQAQALEGLTRAGAGLSSAAADAADDADLDRLRADNGRFDLPVIAGLEDPLARALSTLEGAEAIVDDVQRPVLLPLLDEQVGRFDREVDDALPDAHLALDGVRLAPDLLGGHGTRRYLLAFVTPSENRALGGFIGSYGELTATNGDLDLARSGSIEEVMDGADAHHATLDGPAGYLGRYGRYHIEHYVGDATLSPNMPDVAQVLQSIYPQATGRQVDGVISVDPVALQALLTFTGPIQLDGVAEPLTSDNAADFLLRRQYELFDQRTQRQDFLEEASRKTFEALTDGDIPGPRDLAEVLGPAAHEGRLMAGAFAPDEEALVREIGLDGAFPSADGGDLIGLVTNNYGNNKIDAFMRRSLTYEATVDPSTGAVRGTARVTIANDAPTSGLSSEVLDNRDLRAGGGTPLGTNMVNLSLYTPLGMDRATLGDQGLPLSVSSEREFGVSVYSTIFNVPPGGSVTLRFDLSGTVDLSDGYRLAVANQPTVNPDDVQVAVSVGRDWRLDPAGAGPTRRWQPAIDATSGDRRLHAALVAP